MNSIHEAVRRLTRIGIKYLSAGRNMSKSSFIDSRLVAIYDTLNPSGPCEEFYTNLAGSEAKMVLDVGCGTGRLACELAARGHSVTGVDPSEAMLDMARKRPNGDRVEWTKVVRQIFW